MPISSRHVDALEARVRELEQAKTGTTDSSFPTHLSAPISPLAQHHASATTQHAVTAPPRTRLAQTIDTRQSSNLAKQNIFSVPSVSPQPRRPYGISSSLHFALTIKASATAMTADGLSDHDHTTRTVGAEARNESSSNAETEDADEEEDGNLVSSMAPSMAMSQLLPHRHLAKALFDKYFQAVHPMWPFLLETESRELFTNTWTSEEPPETLWLVRFNLILCLGCQHYKSESNNHGSPAFDAIASEKDFYHRAQEYVYANTFTASSVGMVQALLLMALYQQGQMQFNDFYLTTGHASRTAQSLGLHLSRAESNETPPQQRELRRRLWWGCFCLER